MTWNEFYQALKAKDIAPVYLFTGPEAYIKREALEALRAALLPPGLEALNDATLEGVTAQQITDACETMPMMCEKRIVTVRDWAPLMPGKAKNEEADAEWMQKWLENPPETCALVFYMRSDMDGRKKMATLLKKKAVVVDFQLLTDAELTRWCARRLKPLGKRISPAALNTLTYMAGRELTRLAGELDKLADFLGNDREEITEADVRAIVTPSIEFDIYELLNQLLARDMAKAQQTVNRLIETGQNAVGILTNLTYQLRQLTHTRLGLDAGEALPVIARRLGRTDWQAKMTARQCAGLGAAWLQSMYLASEEYDYAIKSGRIRDQEALHMMMFKLASPGPRA